MSRGNEPMTIKELLHRRKADVAAKRVKKEEKEGESILEEGQQLMQKYVETIDHGVITNRYLETYIYDENAEVNRELDEDFENLYAQNLPPDVTVSLVPNQIVQMYLTEILKLDLESVLSFAMH